MTNQEVLERPTTIRLPEAEVALGDGHSLQVKVRSVSKTMLLDQGNDVQVDAGQGCISSPNGPRC